MYKLIDNFFSKEECNSAIDEINQNQSSWYLCGETGMYILGNSFLRREFNTHLNKIYEFDAANLFKEKLLDIFPKIDFFKKTGKPGFQIIKQNETKKPAVWHYDSILINFPYNLEFADYNNNFNDYFEEYYVFTLMLSDSNSSFDYYPETKSKFGNTALEEQQTLVCSGHVDLIGDDCANSQCQLTKFETIYYNQGSLLVQDDRYLHRVGYKDIDGSNTNRLTLQSYGVVKNGILYLFW